MYPNYPGYGKPKKGLAIGLGFSGFTMQSKKQVEPTINPTPIIKLLSDRNVQPSMLTKQTLFKPEKTIRPAGKELYNPFEPIEPEQTADLKKKKRKRKTRWDTSEEDKADDCPYQRSADSPPYKKKTGDSSSDEDDELDKFMAGIEDEIEKEEHETKLKVVGSQKGKRTDIDDEDDQESYFNAIKDAPMVAYPEDDEELEYDSDGNPIAPERPKIIVPLPPVDHQEIIYESFESNFYDEHSDLAKLTENEVEELRDKLGIKVLGAYPAKPAISFAHFGFDEYLMSAIRKSEYSQPTPIQSQAVPIALSGRDIIGIAKTGSGKTAAFIWPMIVHIMAQPELKEGHGPIGLICAPTRELCQQIYTEAKRFGKCYNLKAVALFGGGSKWEQSKSLQQGAEIVVATPGRLIDLVKVKATNLERVTFLVFDEADRMFDLGFEPQVRSIANHIRPDRQCLLFSATMKKKVERLCYDILTDPIRIVIGEFGGANEDILQVAEVFKSGSEKWQWLTKHLVEFCSGGSVLIFVTKKTNSEKLAKNLQENDHELGLIHGDFDQFERNKVINSFKKGEYPLLVATDVAARGLDIPSIKTVINYDVARDITTHTHRIGRTGRAGEKGVAYTLITPIEVNFAGDLVRNFEGANQRVSEELMEIAMKSPWFRKSRARQGAKGSGMREFKPRDRPGLGHTGQAIEPVEANILEDDEDSEHGPGGGRKASRTLLTSYAFAGSSFGRNRLSNLKSAFSTGYNRFTKASSSTSNTMDLGDHEHNVSIPAKMPEAFRSSDAAQSKKSKWNK